MPRAATSLAYPLWILAVVVVMFALKEAGELFIPVVLALLISYALEPVVAWLVRHHVPRLAGAGALVALIVAIAGWGAYTMRDDALRAVQVLPEVAQRARTLIGSGIEPGTGQQPQPSPEPTRQSTPADVNQPSSAPQGQPPAVSEATITDLAQKAAGSLLALAGHLTVVVFLVLFLLIAGNHFRQRVLEIAGPRLDRLRITANIIDDINAQIQRFLLVQLFTATIVAAVTWGVLSWMEVEQAAVWAIFAGVFNSIPYFGPVVVSGGLLVVGLVQSGDINQGVKLAGAALVITSLEGWVLTPPLMGKAEHMHALVVFLGLLLWTWIWGAWGTILAVPMLIIVKAIADHVESLKPVSRLMDP